MTNQNKSNGSLSSAQRAAGSARQFSTEEVTKALGASTVEHVGNMSPHEQLAWFQARQPRQTSVIPFDNPDLMRSDLFRYIAELKAKDISVAYGNTPSICEDGVEFIKVTPAVLGFVKTALKEAIRDCATLSVFVEQSHPGGSKSFLICNTVLAGNGDPVCKVRLEVSGVTKKISVWLHPLC